MHFHSCVPAVFFAYHLDIIQGGAEETHVFHKNNFVYFQLYTKKEGILMHF